MESPLLQVSILLLIGYVFMLWLADFKSAANGKPCAGSLPGASETPFSLLIIGITGALGLVAIETWGEIRLGVSSEQSTITWLFAMVTIASGFGEELIFRGYLAIQKKGKTVLWLSIFGFSGLFAILHPFLWTWESGSLDLNLSDQSWFSTAIVFLNSLWFYGLRFNAKNENKSLIPCIAAHGASNLAVFLIKLTQGHVGGLY